MRPSLRKPLAVALSSAALGLGILFFASRYGPGGSGPAIPEPAPRPSSPAPDSAILSSYPSFTVRLALVYPDERRDTLLLARDSLAIVSFGALGDPSVPLPIALVPLDAGRDATRSVRVRFLVLVAKPRAVPPLSATDSASVAPRRPSFYIDSTRVSPRVGQGLEIQPSGSALCPARVWVLDVMPLLPSPSPEPPPAPPVVRVAWSPSR